MEEEKDEKVEEKEKEDETEIQVEGSAVRQHSVQERW